MLESIADVAEDYQIDVSSLIKLLQESVEPAKQLSESVEPPKIPKQPPTPPPKELQLSTLAAWKKDFQQLQDDRMMAAAVGRGRYVFSQICCQA